jgi:sporulation protein YlmC with PRC-barrel domain
MKHPLSISLSAASAAAIALVLAGPVMGAASGHGAQYSQPGAAAPGMDSRTQRQEQATSEDHGRLGRWAQDKRVEDITGKDLYDQSGKKLGEIDKIVRDNATNQLSAVVDVGGVAGIGGKAVTIPLSAIDMRNGELRAQAVAGPEQLKQHPYDESQFTDVPDDAKLSEFSALEPGSSGQRPSEQATPSGGGASYRHNRPGGADND